LASPILIRGGTLIDGAGVRRGDVLIHGERIAAVGDLSEAAGDEVIDASGAYVIPGGIDVHTHFDLPVGMVRSADDFESGTIAAACGGTTCVIDFAGAGRESPPEALAEWHEKALGRAVIDYGFHLTVTSVPEDEEEARTLFEWFVSEGVTSVKLYMAYPERLMVDDATLSRALSAGREAGVRVCVHAEDGAEIERLITEALAEGPGGPWVIPRVRPPGVEAEAVSRASRLANDAGTTVYVVHLSSAESLGAEGALYETCPQYLYLDQSVLTTHEDAALDFVCQPPVRDRGLWEALASGAVKIVSTDHCSFTKADRRKGVTGEGWSNFTQIPGGLPGVETRLSLIHQGVVDGKLSLERWVDACVVQPARLFGLHDRKGALTPGLDADVVVFDPSATKELNAASLHSRSDHSPYERMTVTGWPALTYSRGRLVAKGGEPFDAEPGQGRFVPRRLRTSNLLTNSNP
jgi:dihydropyrimidinase